MMKRVLAYFCVELYVPPDDCASPFPKGTDTPAPPPLALLALTGVLEPVAVARPTCDAVLSHTCPSRAAENDSSRLRHV